MMSTRRGTSHANVRGSAAQRRALRTWMIETFGVDGILACALCNVPLLADGAPDDPERFVVGRIIPGCRGGRYVRGNVRPECVSCSSSEGGRTRSGGRESKAVFA